jgi:hypothetical protein
VQSLLRELKADAPDDDGPDALDDGDVDHDSDAAGQGSQLGCIAKVRGVIVKIRSSLQCDASRVPREELTLDTTPARAMLERAYELRMPLSRMARLNSDFQEPSDDEWDLVVKVSFCSATCPA